MIPLLQGYTAHVINTGAEWVVAGVMVIFFLTYFPDFRAIGVVIGVKLKGNHGYQQISEDNNSINNSY